MRNRITIQEFAEKTGVSIATVSRAFTGNGRISQETRKRILDSAQKYGYFAGSRKLKSENDIPELVFFYPEIYTGSRIILFPRLRSISSAISEMSMFSL